MPLSGQQLPLDIGLLDSASFASYYTGSNREAAQSVADAAERGGQFIYLWGKTGTGKTHLLHAACRHSADCGAAPAYFNLTQASLLAPEILESLEQRALVCLDDIHAIAGKSDWEAALFHLYNRIRDHGACLLISARARPAEIGLAMPDLASRLNGSLIFQLQESDDEEKLAALQLRARGRGMELPEEVGRFLLRRCPRDMHALFDLLQRLDEGSLSLQRKLTIPFVRQFVEAGDQV